MLKPTAAAMLAWLGMRYRWRSARHIVACTGLYFLWIFLPGPHMPDDYHLLVVGWHMLAATTMALLLWFGTRCSAKHIVAWTGLYSLWIFHPGPYFPNGLYLLWLAWRWEHTAPTRLKASLPSATPPP